jgi:hypothetical protein
MAYMWMTLTTSIAYYLKVLSKISREINLEKANTDRARENDKITFDVIKDIMNTVDSDIQMRGDIPLTNSDKKVPVLDMNMFMADNSVMFSFYFKPMGTLYVIPE